MTGAVSERINHPHVTPAVSLDSDEMCIFRKEHVMCVYALRIVSCGLAEIWARHWDRDMASAPKYVRTFENFTTAQAFLQILERQLLHRGWDRLSH